MKSDGDQASGSGTIGENSGADGISEPALAVGEPPVESDDQANVTRAEHDPSFFQRTLTDLDIPASAIGELAAAGIDSFVAVRQRRVDVAALTGIAPAAAAKLAAHVRLSAISDDADLNTRLVAAGIGGPIDLAGRDADELTKTLGLEPGVIEPIVQRALLYRASARALLADVTLSGGAVKPAAVVATNGAASPVTTPAGSDGSRRPMLARLDAPSVVQSSASGPGPAAAISPASDDDLGGLCPSWSSALSPAAYLADLVDFLQDSFPDAFPDLASVTGRFYRPIGDLPVSRDSVESPVQQIVIANEVLERLALSQNTWFTQRTASTPWLPFFGAEFVGGHHDPFTEVAAAVSGVNVHLCGLTADGHLWYTTMDPNWHVSPFVDVGAVAGEHGGFAAVACASLEDGTLHVCVITTDGHLWHTIKQSDDVWQPFIGVESAINLQGTFTSVACATSWMGADLHVCAAMADGRLVHAIRLGDGIWQNPDDIAASAGQKGTFTSIACSVDHEDTLHLCGVTADHRLWYTSHASGSTWTPFLDVESQAGEGGAFARVACQAVPYDGVRLCVVTTDGRLRDTVRNEFDGAWAPFGDVESVAGERGTFSVVTLAVPQTDNPDSLYLYGIAHRMRDDLYAEMAAAGSGYPYPDVLARLYDAYLGELGTSLIEIATAYQAAYPDDGSGDRALLDELLGRLAVSEAELADRLHLAQADLLHLDTLTPTLDQMDQILEFLRQIITAGIDPNDPLQTATYHDALARAEAAIGKVQERLLPDLRANLIHAILRTSTTFFNERVLGNYLHLDLSVDSSARTTRVADAMEAIQSFVLAWQLGREDVQLATSQGDFDARWGWLQSYGLWQAAQTVFLYPESFLLPRARRAISPGFNAVLDQLDADSSPESVVTAAEGYARAMPWGLPITTCRVGSRLVVYSVNPYTGAAFVGAFDGDGQWLGWASLDDLITDFRKNLGGARLYGLVEWNRLLYAIFGADAGDSHTRLTFAAFNVTSDGITAQTDLVNVAQTLPMTFQTVGEITSGIGFVPMADSIRIYTCPQIYLIVYDLRPDGSLTTIGTPIPLNFPLHDVVGALGDRHYLLSGSPESTSWLTELDPSGAAAPKMYRLPLVTLPPGSLPIQGRSIQGAIQGNTITILSSLTAQYDRSTSPLPNPTNVNKLTTFTPGAGAVGPAVNVTIPGPYFGAVSMQPFGSGFQLLYGYSTYNLSVAAGGGWTVEGPNRLSWLPNGSNLTVGQDRLARPETADGQPDYYTRYRNEQAYTFVRYPASDPAYLYLEEYYLFLPLAAASSLSQNQHFHEADSWLRLLYNPLRSAVGGGPIIYQNLIGDGSAGYEFRDSLAWLRDPFNPYLIAKTRQGVFLRHAIYRYAENVLEWADAEFARDSAEAINRARELYELADDLLARGDVPQDPYGTAWRDLLDKVQMTFQPEQARIVLLLLAPVEDLGGRVTLTDLTALSALIRADVPFATTAGAVKQLVDTIAARPAPDRTLAGLMSLKADARAQEPLAEDTYARLMAERYGDTALAFGAPGANGAANGASNGIALSAISPETSIVEALSARIGNGFLVPPDPQLNILRWRIATNLDKIRTGRNMAGLRRTVQTYAAPVDARAAVQSAASGTLDADQLIPSAPPSIYRFSFLVERARYFISVAQQLEGQLLASFEKGDEAAYSLMKARQDLKAADANLALQALKVKEAGDGVQLAQLQFDKATFQQQHFSELLQADLNHYETEALKWLQNMMRLQLGIAAAQTALAVGMVATGVGALAGAQELLSAAQTAAGALGSLSQWNSMQATFERRREEWRFQRDLARQDVAIGKQGFTLANDRVGIANQEQDIARSQKDFANQVIDFLSTKFTNKELYDWMAQILRRLYRDHLNAATVIARQAQQALAFERQEPIAIIAPYYAEREKRDLLAAEQLLTDLNALDQHRLATEQRRRELTKVISLAAAAPVELEQLRREGWLELTTSLAWFDRDFPGHYLRLIKSVTLTLVGLIPPGEAIHATLSNDGLSRVMVGPPFDTTRVIQRLPESISVTTASNGSGLFELRLDDPILLPFEGNGVETTWRLELPKGANRFDFTTLVDVLLTVRYTALEDRDYRRKVLRSLGANSDGWVNVDGMGIFSARDRFADAWYQFQNPTFLPTAGSNGASQPARPYSLRFDLKPSDFRPNEEILPGLSRLIVVGAGEAPGRVPLEVTFTPANPPAGWPATARAIGDLVDGQLIVSSNQSLPLDTVTPFGAWTVRVRNEESPVGYPEVIGTGTGGGRATWDRVGKVGRQNVALASSGATASASSVYDGDTPPSAAINGERKAAVWPGYWADNTPYVYPDWLEVQFGGPKTIDEIDVFTTQDAPLEGTGPAVEPTATLTFARYGITAFDVQYWSGATWVTVPNGSITGNNLVWRKLTFPAVTTDRVRVQVNATAGPLSRIVELEAYETGTHRNVALAANGGQARASSIALPYPPDYAINGQRGGRGWNGQVPFAFPGWFQVNLNGLQQIDQVAVFSAQDPPEVPPTDQLTFSRYGLTDFEVQYWDGGTWVTVPGGAVRGNNKVWRTVTFPAVTTDRVRIVIQATSDGWVRLAELEVYGYGAAETMWLDDAPPAGATSTGGTGWSWVSASPAPSTGTRALQSAMQAGLQEYSFSGASAPLAVNAGDLLFAYVYLDPDNPPSGIMLQWFDGSWEHRAYWGVDTIARGTAGTASRRFMGPLPAVGRWVRLEVPAGQVGLENRSVTGMSFLVYGERQLDLQWLDDVVLVPRYQARTRYVL
jgi:hypothetical protein